MALDHLSLPHRITGLYNSPYGPGKRAVVVPPSPETLTNIENREVHGNSLEEKTSVITGEWTNAFEERKELGLPNIPESIPLFLQVDPKIFNPDSLKSFGIEIISEEDDGFLIGASADLNLSTLKDKIDKFLKEEGKFRNTASQLWDIVTGKQWRLDHILSKSLLKKWDEIDDSEIFVLDIAIACFIHVPAYPNRGNEEEISEEQFEEKVSRWEEKKQKAQIDWDDVALKRQDELEKFINEHKGELISSYVDSADSFSCRIEISGLGLKDLVLNYPYLFEVEEYDNLKQSISIDDELKELGKLEINGPEYDDPNVCVIDSGIQENHVLLEKAIDNDHSISYVKNKENIVSDLVVGGGHGTRVAGAVLYPKLPTAREIKLNSWIQNARVLDANNIMQPNLYPPDLMKDIIEHYNESYGTRIFNMSITSRKGHITTRMSKWAESIDRQSWERDIVFVIPTGNLKKKQIENYVNNGTDYADYLLLRKSRISNPSQSLFSLTVGSICNGEYEDDDLKSFGEIEFPSAFTRTGLGIWDSIKPELVEYGGDYVIEKIGANRIASQKQESSIHLVRSTLNGGPATSIDGIGTSFSAPKVSGILAELQRLFPEESTLLYKALIIQSARWPSRIFNGVARLSFLRLYGYGLPNLERATTNTDYRVTLVNSLNISPKEADIYEVKLPESMRRVGDSFDILVEVTLTFKAIPRRTRVGFRSYLSGWVDWHSSKLGESTDAFEKRLIAGDYNLEDEEDDINQENIPWTIQSRSNGGVNNVKLNSNTVQKDWAILKSNKLTENFCIGIVGHTGWDKDLKSEMPYSIAVSFEAINKDIELYNEIRIENAIEIQVDV
ncbi:S8 family peptidase [Changchengzhania lutea]|uniref:S8 family peptidase n=1 Tax=Changchengzhania lutea TaxID=2049305 RepID=UPI00115ED39C|nr:S8 family peptidase [Changchengzhania lutea]